MIFQQRDGVVGSEDPVVERSFGVAQWSPTGAWARAPAPHRDASNSGAEEPYKNFLRAQLLDLFLNSFGGVLALELGGAKFAGGKVERGESHALAVLRDRREKIVFFRTQRGICRRARRDHSRHFPPHQLLGHARIFHLLADRDLESLANQLGDVSFGGVMGYAAHGNGDTFFLVAGGERDLQFARGQDRVVKEKLVEIPQAEEQQGAGMLFLDGGILPHQRSGRLGHLWRVRGRIITKEIAGFRGDRNHS